ncbi:DUF2442 domain-containing protein [Gaopeijia maritima]|uniref:DUF2442 domain-containing protein n=1 Tax=Gaopeijia maritima TaxID=3119007 RepID=A0ABU9E9X4_9BACT
MTSQKRGPETFRAEVGEVYPDGFSIRVDDETLVVSFAEFPWFKGVPEESLRAVTRPQPHHLRWKALDVDLTLDSLRHPDRYPLISRK